MSVRLLILIGVDLREQISGCLLAGAVGDALGGPVEFMRWAEIRRRFGPAGVTQAVSPAEFTDDTQMTLFTVEGLIRARVQGRSKGLCHPPSVVRHAYLRWLHTQGIPWAQAGAEFAASDPEPDGWLVRQQVLHRQMAPGNTCMSALLGGGTGTVTEPANGSKGCGAVMRAAPVGFFSATPGDAWDMACQIAAITHGHPDGSYPAGVLAVTIRLVADGLPLADAIRAAAEFVPRESATRQALDRAFGLACEGQPDPDGLNRSLGQGWTGDEALAIAACCALSAATPAAAILAAVNHSGDSDSTGSITGNIVGALHGTAALPDGWLDALDGRELVAQVAADAATELLDPPRRADSVPQQWWDRYPGW
jgi:ADP-ribosylglycohydrolase